MLSVQGASLFEREYIILTVLMGVCVITGLLVWRFREPFYRWIEKQNHIEL